MANHPKHLGARPLIKFSSHSIVYDVDMFAAIKLELRGLLSWDG